MSPLIGFIVNHGQNPKLVEFCKNPKYGNHANSAERDTISAPAEGKELG
jgi:hypothetical protein